MHDGAIIEQMFSIFIGNFILTSCIALNNIKLLKNKYRVDLFVYLFFGEIDLDTCYIMVAGKVRLLQEYCSNRSCTTS